MVSRVWATVTLSPKVKRRRSHLKNMGAARPIPEANCAWAGVKSRGCGNRPATRTLSMALRMRPPRLSLTAPDPPPPVDTLNGYRASGAVIGFFGGLQPVAIPVRNTFARTGGSASAKGRWWTDRPLNFRLEMPMNKGSPSRRSAVGQAGKQLVQVRRPSGNEQMTEKTTIGKTKQKLPFQWVEEGFEVPLSVQPPTDPPVLNDTAVSLRSESGKGKKNPPLNPAKP